MVRLSAESPPPQVSHHALVALDFIGRPPEIDSPCLAEIERGHSREARSRGRDKARGPSGAPAGAGRARFKEGEDAYPALAHLGAQIRVIDCKDGLQWILQRRVGKRWRSISFHRDRDVLINRCGASGDALDILRALPGRHP